MINSPQHSASKVNTFKILSIDGGGIKGLYSAKILEHFEDRFKCHLADYFDLICGTSTGGLIALGLSLKIPVSQISNVYYKQGKKIFLQPNSFISSLKQFFQRSKYDNSELRKALEELFENQTITDSHCLLCIPAFSLTDGRPFIFKYDHNEGNLCRDSKTRYVDIALATSAAPTYLPIVTIDTYDRKQFIDGGVCANNPTLVGVVEALRYFVGNDKRFQKLMVMSIGSLEPNPGRRFVTKHDRSVIDWNKDLIATFFEGQAYLTSYFVETLAQHCDSPFDYVRIPGIPLSPDHARIINLDNTSDEALNLMSQMGTDQALVWGRKPEVAEFFKEPKQYIIK
ncbi:CBASS cGAMP-activated phospholipase [Argonema antarcticum]|uniref:CBASS cGAMP-activated phospholipase n=1 Tax=Argonema antarcticum TaxID=2942763 RepID=UPI0020122C8A|nr:CBASS cGAMP-activated phospholipase [Argonema antarcticum]MCL1475739.1 patatin-like phospholipase family protein [Argonema antarcticum A004/B2]